MIELYADITYWTKGLGDALAFGIISGVLYALVVVGYSLIYSVLGVINFAHGDLLAVGVYICFILGAEKIGMPLPTAVLSAAIITGVISLVIGRFLLMPAGRRSPVAALVVAIGISIALQNLIAMWCSPEAKPFHEKLNFTSDFLPPFSSLHLGLIPSVLIVLSILWFGLLKGSSLGLKIRACASNPLAAYSFGFRQSSVYSFVFFLSGVLAALAGIAKGLDDHIIVPTMGFSLGIRAFIASVIGGINSLWGAVAGAFLLGISETLLLHFMTKSMILLPYAAMVSKDAVAIVLLVCILLWRPKGIFSGQVERRP